MKRLKYFSFDKIQYLYFMEEDSELPFVGDTLLDPDLKIAG